MPADDPSLATGNSAGSCPNPHGQAALLLVESLLHHLKERSILTLGDAIDIVDTAIAVQAEFAEEAEVAAPGMDRSLTLLTSIANSLRRDTDAGGSTVASD